MVGGTVEAKIDSKGNGTPCRILGATIEADLDIVSEVGQLAAMKGGLAYLVGGFLAQFGEDCLRLSLCSKRHDGSTKRWAAMRTGDGVDESQRGFPINCVRCCLLLRLWTLGLDPLSQLSPTASTSTGPHHGVSCSLSTCRFIPDSHLRK